VDARDTTGTRLKMFYDCIDGKKTVLYFKDHFRIDDWSSVALNLDR